MKTNDNIVRLKVINPSSKISIGAKNAPRLDTLNGKTICEVLHASQDVEGWRGSDTFPAIREVLKKQFPDVKIIPYTEFPQGARISSFPFWMPSDEIAAILKNKGCDAVLVGNGG